MRIPNNKKLQTKRTFESRLLPSAEEYTLHVSKYCVTFMYMCAQDMVLTMVLSIKLYDTHVKTQTII